MPKNPVTDPITDQEMAFAHLVLSGTMNDREAAEAAGLNPDTAAYTKSRPRVRAYMIEHRAAVSEKLADHEAEGLRNLNLGRDQILARLWQLATLSPEETRGSIAGQIKALSMIVAIEGLIPSGRAFPARMQPTVPPATPKTFAAEPLRPQPQTDRPAQPAAPQVPQPKTPKTANQTANQASPFSSDRNLPSPINPFVHPAPLSRTPEATAFVYDAMVNPAADLRLSFPPMDFFNRGRSNR